MAKFSVTIDGKSYEIEGPADATLVQATAILTKQINTGSLIGLKPNDLLNAVTQASQGLQSAVAQLGAQAEAKIKALSTQLPDLNNILPKNPINVADFAKQKLDQVNIGTLVPSQVQGLLAQTANFVNQPATAITNALGVGKYGMQAAQLEKLGVLKPGTSDLITKGIGSLDSVLGSPASWTGKLGITDLNSVLSNSKIQDVLQNDLMKSGFQQLNNLGAITQNLNPATLGPLVTNAAKYGAEIASKWAAGATANLPTELVGQLNVLASSAVFAQAFAAVGPILSIFGGGSSPLVTTIKKVEGYVNTVNRATTNFGVKAIVNNSKVSIPNFDRPKPAASTILFPLITQVRSIEKSRSAFGVKHSAIYGTQVTSNNYVSVIAQIDTAIAEIKGLITTATELETRLGSIKGTDLLLALIKTIIGNLASDEFALIAYKAGIVDSYGG